MTEFLTVMIDVSEVELGVKPEDVEARSLALADDLREGKLADSAKLVRQEGDREGAKSGMLGFVGGLVTAEISRERLKQLFDFLGNRFYGKSVTVSYKTEAFEFSAEHRNQADMDRALAAIERLKALHQSEPIEIKVTKTIDV
jgi:hypothetical protein